MPYAAILTDRAMDGWAEYWALIKEVFAGALALSADERPAYLRGACGKNEQLRGRVERLLASRDQAGSFLESSAEASMEPVPERFGPYRILAQLGEGGTGRVYEAMDERLNRRVALKLIRRNADTSNTRERFGAKRA